MLKEIAVAVSLSILFFLTVTVTYSQSFRLALHTGYTFDDQVDYFSNNTSYFSGKVQGAFRWGFEAEYKVQPVFGVGLLYLTQQTNVPLSYYYNGDKNHTFDMRINWYMLSIGSFLPRETFEPYFTMLGGTATVRITDPGTGYSTSITKPAWGMRGGTNWFFSEHIGVKAQADLMSVIKGIGGTIYADNSGVASYGYVSSLQFTLGGGVFYKF